MFAVSSQGPNEIENEKNSHKKIKMLTGNGRQTMPDEKTLSMSIIFIRELV